MTEWFKTKRHSKDISPGKSTSNLKSYNPGNRIKPPSLRNIGATCYLNSAIQGLSSCDQFVKEIHKLYKPEANFQLCPKWSIFCDLISLMNGGHSGHMEISRNRIFQSWRKSGQQDSFELLSYVLNQVYNELRKNEEDAGNIEKRDVQSWLKIPLPMRMIIHYEIKCGCGNHINVPLQSDLALHVTIPLKEKMDLQVLIDRFFADDKIEDYECDEEGCKQNSLAVRTTRLCLPLPNTICVHLQRTHWNGWFMKKINDKIRFEDQLIIKSKFCVPEKRKENEMYKEELLSNKNKKMEENKRVVPDKDWEEKMETSDDEVADQNGNVDKSVVPEKRNLNFGSDRKETPNKNHDQVFNLTSVIVHHGSVHCGHYVCYRCVDKQWFLTNDSEVREVNANVVLNSMAYILFYEKP